MLKNAVNKSRFAACLRARFCNCFGFSAVLGSTGTVRERCWPAWKSPLPFSYESTGAETFFTNRLDSDPCSRRVFSFHRAETLLTWVQQQKQLAQRLREFPAWAAGTLWPAQIQAINSLERSFAKGRPRALIQMATGSDKTYTAVNFIYRLVKYGGAKRVLFLVDRGNLGRQTLKEFQQFVSPVNNYKFTEEYIVQHLSSNSLDKSARVVIGTVQRIYSMLKGEKEPAPDLDDLTCRTALTPSALPFEKRNSSRASIVFGSSFGGAYLSRHTCHASLSRTWKLCQTAHACDKQTPRWVFHKRWQRHPAAGFSPRASIINVPPCPRT